MSFNGAIARADGNAAVAQPAARVQPVQRRYPYKHHVDRQKIEVNTRRVYSSTIIEDQPQQENSTTAILSQGTVRQATAFLPFEGNPYQKAVHTAKTGNEFLEIVTSLQREYPCFPCPKLNVVNCIWLQQHTLNTDIDAATESARVQAQLRQMRLNAMHGNAQVQEAQVLQDFMARISAKFRCAIAKLPHLMEITIEQKHIPLFDGVRKYIAVVNIEHKGEVPAGSLVLLFENVQAQKKCAILTNTPPSNRPEFMLTDKYIKRQATAQLLQ